MDQIVKERLLFLRREHLKNEARKGNILAFTKFTKPDYKTNWHHQLTCKYINKFIRGEIKRLMVLEPPGHGKSELTSRRLPPLLHGLFPDAEIMAASYSSSLADDMTSDVQRIMDTPQYAELFPNTTIPRPGTRDAVYVRRNEEHHIMGHKGKYRGQGVGGAFTGKRARFVLIDDPIKGREDADSPAFRDKLWKFYTNDLRSRMADSDGRILLTQTCWHEDDLAHRLMDLAEKDPSADQWTILRLEAIRESEDIEEDPRELGEVLWPERFPLSELHAIRAGDPRGFSALYQQSPTPLTGGLFTESMFEFGPMPQRFDYKFITADTAYKEKKENDFTVFTAWGVVGQQPYIEDVLKKKMNAADIEAPAMEFIKKHSTYGFRGAYIEPKGHGIYLNQSLPRKGIMMPTESQLKEFFSDRNIDKVQRANNAVPWLSNRKIIINEAIHGKEELRAEVLRFPKAKHDDFTDTVIDGVKMIFGRRVSILDVL